MCWLYFNFFAKSQKIENLKKISKIKNLKNLKHFKKIHLDFFWKKTLTSVPKTWHFMGGSPFWHTPWDMANCLRAIEKGRTCMCKCRHGLRMLVRAKLGCQPQCPGMQVFGTMTLQHALRMAECKCCADHQNRRPDVDEIQELFWIWMKRKFKYRCAQNSCPKN